MSWHEVKLEHFLQEVRLFLSRPDGDIERVGITPANEPITRRQPTGAAAFRLVEVIDGQARYDFDRFDL